MNKKPKYVPCAKCGKPILRKYIGLREGLCVDCAREARRIRNSTRVCDCCGKSFLKTSTSRILKTCPDCVTRIEKMANRIQDEFDGVTPKIALATARIRIRRAIARARERGEAVVERRTDKAGNRVEWRGCVCGCGGYMHHD